MNQKKKSNKKKHLNPRLIKPLKVENCLITALYQCIFAPLVFGRLRSVVKGAVWDFKTATKVTNSRTPRLKFLTKTNPLTYVYERFSNLYLAFEVVYCSSNFIVACSPITEKTMKKDVVMNRARKLMPHYNYKVIGMCITSSNSLFSLYGSNKYQHCVVNLYPQEK